MGMEFGALLPEILVLAGAVVGLLAGSFLPRERQVIATSIVGVALALAVVAALAAAFGPSRTIFFGSFAVDPGTALIRMAAPTATIVVLLIGRPELRGTVRESETSALLALGTLGAMVLAGASDLLVLGTGFLLSSIPLYALIGVARSPGAAEAALKTYLQGALLGTTMFGGIAVLFGLARETTYAALAEDLGDAPRVAVVLGAVAVIAGLLFESGAVPGHFWVPDATQASGRAVAAYLTTVPKIAGLLALGRLVAALPGSANIPLLIAIVAAATMTIGNLAAFWQTDARRMLGWSSVSQVGYLLLPIVAVREGLPALAIYIVGYAVTNLAAFAVLAALPRRVALADWAGASRASPVLTGVLVVALLGLVGTPPVGVFAGKVAVFAAAWSGGYAWLVVVAALNTVASLFYYLRWVVAALGPTESESEPPSRLPAAVAVVLGILLIGTAVVAIPALGAAAGAR